MPAFRLTLMLAFSTLLLLLAACVRPVPDVVPPPTIPVSDPQLPTDPTFPTLILTDTVNGTGILTDTVLPPGSVPSGTISIPADNVTGTVSVEPTIDPAAVEVTGPPANTVHTVQSGETLLTISQIYGVTIDDIVLANNLPNANILAVGQELLIPAPGFAENPANQPTPAPTATTTTAEQLHVVVQGDTLYSIGRTYGFTIDELVAYNNLTNPDALKIGDEIRIPPRP
jgi:membrane-bound lytic murein transglycosylase D